MTEVSRTDSDTGLDRYWTPPWCTRLVVEVMRERDLLPPDGCIAEPCCGAGWIAEELVDLGYTVRASDVDASEYYSAVEAPVQSATARQRMRGCAAVITNPPYTTEHTTAGYALNAIRHTVPDTPVAALLRLSWLEGMCEDRQWAWQRDRPELVYEIGRVEYAGPDGGGGSNPQTSVWVIWGGGPAESTEYLSAPQAARDRARGQENLI